MDAKMTAVRVRGACKSYGRGKAAQLVLDSLDMTVEKGTIYGLLGASGCGKTTLLTCIVGRRRLGDGEIWVLGGKPGSRGSGVPGPRLGYMPQELSLMNEFSVRDALQHFAWIYGMSNDRFEKRFQFLSQLLELPPSETFVKNLSGGQQRRTSLAVALIHEPELLILDEPTVGLDPVLRQSIWDHLVSLANKGDTVIITTHYIEEARQANAIGLMRNGRLVAEGTPTQLMTKYNSASIEDVFLRLSALQDASVRNTVMSNSAMELTAVSNTEAHRTDQASPPEAAKADKQIAPPPPRRVIHGSILFKNRGHAKALLSKNFYRITRNPGAILFIFLFPMLEICTFYWTVGGWPRGLVLGVANDELGNFTSCQEFISSLGSAYGGSPNETSDGLDYCVMRGLSCMFLESFGDSLVKKTYYKNVEEATADARAGHILGLVHFPHNYSEAFEARTHLGADTHPRTVELSILPVRLDMSLRQSAVLVEEGLREAHREFVRGVLEQCNISGRVADIPINMNEPVYGERRFDYSRFMTPGVVITMIFFISVGVTAMIVVVERLDGIWDRTLCSGVSSQEILLSHVLIEAGIVVLQTAEVFILVFYVFKMPCLGSFVHIMILLFLQGFTGMCGGFLVSVSCNTITAANFVSMGSFYPVLILSGLLWPIEGMPFLLKYLSIGLPTTLATTALRNIIEKGWGMFDNQVYQGYVVSLVWIFLFSAMSLTVIRLRK